MAMNKVEICGVDTSTLPVISNERMRELFPLVHSGDLNAREEFIRGNLRLVLSVIQRFSNRGENVDDLFQVGCIGYKALKARDRLAERMGREPNVTELAEELKLPREDVVFALEAIQDPVSLFEPVYNDGGDALYIMDQVTDNKRPDNNWLDVIGVREALSRLSEREKHILTLRFFQGRTQMEIAGEIGISQAQVSRLEKNALNHMKKHVDKD